MRKEFIGLALAAWIGLGVAFAADERKEKEEAEARDAAAEDQANGGKDFPGGHEFIAAGILALTPAEGDERPAVIGAFSSNGKVYEIKVSNEKLRQELKPFNNKKVELGGRIRNQGKYFIVDAIITSGSGAPTALRRKRSL